MEVIPDPAVPASDPLEDLGHLVEQSVLKVATDPDGEPRFSMLETIREFAGERLDALTEKQTIERRHAETYLAIAEHAAEELLGEGQKACSTGSTLKAGTSGQRSAGPSTAVTSWSRAGWGPRCGASGSSAVILLKAVNGSIAFLRCRPLRTE